jgi:hypothetical protein
MLMGNQQPSNLEERITFLAKNAVFGDGQVWKHPECRNYKVIYTSTTPELLEVKRSIAPEIFKTGVKFQDLSKAKRYANAKPMYRLASIVHPLITDIHNIGKQSLYTTLTLEDLALWYLDDGSTVKRTDTKGSYRYILCIGNCCSTPEDQDLFTQRLRELFGANWGSIRPNNSKATENNKSWKGKRTFRFL